MIRTFIFVCWLLNKAAKKEENEAFNEKLKLAKMKWNRVFGFVYLIITTAALIMCIDSLLQISASLCPKAASLLGIIYGSISIGLSYYVLEKIIRK